ncbi:MAG TPA: hypothetical protein VK489_09765 [Ferruginibacter sp.]|nr:hypothetical protein [Ferruginibacter sp.]
MIDVIQIFKSEERYKKDNYETAKLLNQWEDSLTSRNGYLKDHTLYLPDTADPAPGIEDARIVIIQDIKGFEPFSAETSRQYTRKPRWHMDTNKKHMLYVNDEIICFYKLAASINLGILRLEKEQPGSFILSLNYTGHVLEMGIPERNDHKIAQLKAGKPVRYRTNGKSDFTMSGRKDRTFAEYDFIIAYIGQADKVIFKDAARMETVKKLPADYKLVDERKILK